MNYKEIIENLDIDKIKVLLDKLNIEYKENDTCLIMPTVCHNEDAESASWKLYYYKNSHMFVCYTSCSNMTIFTFLKRYYEVRNIEYDWYEDIYKLILSCLNFDDFNLNFNRNKKYKSIKDNYANYKDRKEIKTYPSSILNMFQDYYPVEWLSENISKKTMDKFNIKFSIIQNKIIIPHYNINNELVGIRGRALNMDEVEHVGKYMPVCINNIWYSHPLSLNLYGLNLTKDNIKKYGVVYMFEGEKSVLKLEDFDIPNCSVATCGSHINKYQIDILLRYCKPKEIILCYDKEQTDNGDAYFNSLYSMCKKYSKYCNFSFIYDRQNITPYKSSPCDNGEKSFIELLKKKVKV